MTACGDLVPSSFQTHGPPPPGPADCLHFLHHTGPESAAPSQAHPTLQGLIPMPSVPSTCSVLFCCASPTTLGAGSCWPFLSTPNHEFPTDRRYVDLLHVPTSPSIKLSHWLGTVPDEAPAELNMWLRWVCVSFQVWKTRQSQRGHSRPGRPEAVGLGGRPQNRGWTHRLY